MTKKLNQIKKTNNMTINIIINTVQRQTGVPLPPSTTVVYFKDQLLPSIAIALVTLVL